MLGELCDDHRDADFIDSGGGNMAATEERQDRVCVRCGDPFTVTLKVLTLAGKRWPLPAPSACPDCDMERQRTADMERRRAEEAEAAARASMLEHRLDEMLPPKYRDADMAQLPEALQERLNSWWARPSWLYLTGPLGTGKTYGAAALVKDAWGRTFETGAWANVPILMETLRRSFAQKEKGAATKKVADLIEQLCMADVAVLDDIGRENPTPFVVDRLYVVVEYRYEHGLPTLFTSNCSLTNLGERVGDQIASRLSEVADQIGIGGDDRRAAIGKARRAAQVDA